MITLVVNGTPYTRFVSATVNVRLSALCNDFSFVSSAVTGFPPLALDDDVQVLIDGQLACSGYIDRVNGGEADGSHLVTYQGRDYTGDLVSSQLDALPQLNPSDALTLKAVTEIVIAHLGLNLKVVDTVNPAPFNLAEDIVRADIGENAFDFLSKWAKKRQVLLSSTPSGDVLITQSAPTDSGAVLRRQQGQPSNIVSQSFAVSKSERFRRYVVRGQLSPSALDYSGGYTSQDVEDQVGEATDRSVREGRQRVLVAGESYSDEQLTERAKWVKQLAKARGTTFSCTVKGHTNSAGDVWAVNTLALVLSDVADISRQMLLDSVSFMEGEGRQTVSALSFVERDVYTVDDKILAQKPAGSLLDELTF